jgi:dihydrofolate reductase
MIISLIAALDEEGVIGKEGRVPWRLPADLRLFRQLTMGHHLIVGRTTYESIGRPLPGRMMIVLSTRPDYRAEGCQTAASLRQALDMAGAAGEDEVFIGGGAEVYAQALPISDRFYLSRVHASVAGDTRFPLYDPNGWREELRHTYPSGEGQPLAFTFFILERKNRAN